MKGARPRGGSSTQPCRFFSQNGTCRLGERCKFSHDTPSGGSPAALPGRAKARARGGRTNTITTERNGDGKLKEWKRLLSQSAYGTRPQPAAVARFFSLALELMDGDIGGAQETIRLLASEEGLSFIKDATDDHIQSQMGAAADRSLWTSEFKPLFSLITHPLVVDSAVLEQQVAIIYNFLYGVGGDRMSRVFDFCVNRVLLHWPKPSPDSSSEASMAELALAALSKLLDCNTSNIVNAKFMVLVAGLSQTLEKSSRPEDEFSRLQASRHLDYIRLRLDIGEQIGVLQRPTRNPTREQFRLRRDLPGHLSADGRRHDNDDADITKIKILPSAEEIMSPRAEYLPTTDPSTWHVKGIRGRLDREFRLLREDTVGQLRDAVRETLESVRNPAPAAHLQRQKSTQTYKYDFPVIEDISFNSHSGIKLLVRCNQPFGRQSSRQQNSRQQSPQQRKDWWMQCKRLQAGGLVCILDAETSSVLFCVVSESTMRSSDDTKSMGGRARRPTQHKMAQELTRHAVDISSRTVNGSGALGHQEADDDTSSTPVKHFTLSDDGDFLFVRLHLVDPSSNEVEQTLRWWQEEEDLGQSSRRRYLVEFPGVLLGSFKDTLMALQQKYQRPDIPFSHLIAPTVRDSVLNDTSTNLTDQEVEIPQYATTPGFVFDLRSLTADNGKLVTSPRAPISAETLSSRSTLDATQSSALLSTLCRQLSLIQGPPGTGKSYTGEKIIQVLLDNRKKANLGPILCVCYTNHALDQLLEHLLDNVVNKPEIIRIGSRSKSERLEGLNLRIVSQNTDRTKSEKTAIWKAEQEIRETVDEAEALLQQLFRSSSWKVVKEHLAGTNSRHHDQLFPEEEEGWRMVNHQPGRVFEKWIAGGNQGNLVCRPIEALVSLPHLSFLTADERRLLHRHWVWEIRDKLIKNITRCHDEFADIANRRARFRREVELRCLNGAEVIGVTTTGLARNLDLLKRVRCKVLVCEEAGEVLEAHILTALLPSVQHAILIGDHLQLRPQIQNYDLQSTNPRGAQFSLDVSLFERLVQGQAEGGSSLPLSVLETQRRMHPSIAELIRPTLYPSLKDHERVSRYPKVAGMKKRLFWFHHENLESGATAQDPLSTSHTNPFEVEMTVALVSHLVRQGEYSRNDIAVITPYLGQLLRLRRRMETMFEICLNDRDLEDARAVEDVEDNVVWPLQRNTAKTTLLKSIRIATVDNFQGEEAKVVVISLVRSNQQNNCGFLRTSNRINVLLSRAQHGMYIIGNANTYGNIPMWANVIGTLQKHGSFGTSFELQCQRHPDTPIQVSQPDHFVQRSPESGCNLPCHNRLACGHACNGRCHADILHNAVKCLADCPRSKAGCDHGCPLRCGDPCHKKCQVLLENIDLTLSCGHSIASARCWEAQEPSSIRCTIEVTRRVPSCSHTVRVPCHIDVTVATFTCTAECRHPRTCGHSCSQRCFECRDNHGDCTKTCGRSFTTCRHSCMRLCHEGKPCPPCEAPCEVNCGHSRCSKLCHEPCSPCAEASCRSSCAHSGCTMPCAAPCDWIPCSRRCEQFLECGHQCPSLCGERCPDLRYCQHCGSEDIRSACVDFIEMKEYHEVNLDDEPCLFPDCGHFMTVSSMDGLMSMSSIYELDGNGFPTKILAASKPFSHEEFEGKGIQGCPTCRSSLRNLSRYGRIIRRGILDDATKKFISWSTKRCVELAERIAVEEETLQSTPAPKARLANPSNPNTFIRHTPRLGHLYDLEHAAGNNLRYNKILHLWHEVQSFVNKVRQEEQPFQRVADLVRHANRRRQTKTEFRFEDSVIQVKGHLLARSLLLKTEISVFSDFLNLSPESKFSREAPLKVNWSIYLSECAAIAELAGSTYNKRAEVQAHIIAAQFCRFARDFCLQSINKTAQLAPTAESEDSNAHPLNDQPANEGDGVEKLQKTALDHIDKAHALIAESPSTALLLDELQSVERAIKSDIVFYEPVTKNEKLTIYKAMAKEFSGTGHWYTCENGHPFSIGGCGMPMVQTRCPECGAPVGGENHRAVAGVTSDEDMENLAREIQGFGV